MKASSIGQVAILALVLGCDKGGASQAPEAESSGDAATTCARGDLAAGEGLVAELRGARARGAASLADQRGQLRDVCELGCAPACLEYARTGSHAEDWVSYNQRACEAGAALGCSLADAPEAEAAAEACAGGEVLACGAALAALEPNADTSAAWTALARAAEQGCVNQDGRSCAAAAWARCAVEDRCDGEAITLAETGARLLPSPEIVESLALLQCRAGQTEAADATLRGSCEAGEEAACGRRCASLRGENFVLVRETERERYDTVAVFIALQVDAAPQWYSVLSTMDSAQLAAFEDLLVRFTPELSEPGAKAKVPSGLREQHPELVEAILRSPQLDAKKIKYWFGRLPDMDDEQRANLFESLVKQWWVIPAEASATPQTFIDDLRCRSGGLVPTWPGDA